MLRCLRPFLRAKGKPTLTQRKQASLKERQLTKDTDDLSKSNLKLHETNLLHDMPEFVPPFPKHLPKICLLGILPGIAGTVGMIACDVNSPVFHTYTSLIGTWLGTNMAFFGGSMIGFEAMGYSPANYASTSKVHTIGRLWYGLAHLPLFLICLWSSLNDSWKGFLGVSFGIGVSCLYSFSAVSMKTVPMWFSNFIWLWSAYNCSMALFLTYANFMQESHKHRLKMREGREELAEELNK